MFMLLGALTKNSTPGKLGVLLLLLCPVVLFFAFPGAPVTITGWAHNNYLFSFATLNGSLIKNLSAATLFTDKYSIAVTRCLSFAYTYHYLNWFSKVKIIRWGDLPKKRLILIAILWLLSIALYAIDFRTGLTALFTLSLLHVILEFPLNIATFILIKRHFKKKLQ
jgi:hypothetical protein